MILYPWLFVNVKVVLLLMEKLRLLFKKLALDVFKIDSFSWCGFLSVLTIDNEAFDSCCGVDVDVGLISAGALTLGAFKVFDFSMALFINFFFVFASNLFILVLFDDLFKETID